MLPKHRKADHANVLSHCDNVGDFRCALCFYGERSIFFFQKRFGLKSSTDGEREAAWKGQGTGGGIEGNS